MRHMKKYISLELFFALIATALAWIIFNLNPDLTFRVYNAGIFSWIRRAFNTFSLVVVLLFWAILIFSYFRHHISKEQPSSILRLISNIFQPILWLLVLFYWLWGFSYFAWNPEEKMIQNEYTLSKEEMMESFQLHTIKLGQLRDSILNIDSLVNDGIITSKKDLWSTSIKGVLRPLGYNIKGSSSILMAAPMGILLRFGTAGFYNFVISRPTIDPGLHPIQVPFTSMHELAHTFGVADEASANFIGYIACQKSDDALTKYSAELSFWRGLRAACYYEDSIATNTITQFVSKDVRKDIVNIRKQMNKYPDLIPELRDKFYDLFLKSQGVAAGMGSYDMYIPMVLQWEREQKNNK